MPCCMFDACLRQVVQPVFNLLAEQVGLMGQAGEQPALRLGYDDVNESACISEVRATRKQGCSACEVLLHCGVD